MNFKQRYAITKAGKEQDMKTLTPSAKILVLALQIAEHEKPGGVTREELQAIAGIKGNSFARAWSHLIKENLVQRQPRAA